jgi:hypothetical protein
MVHMANWAGEQQVQAGWADERVQGGVAGGCLWEAASSRGSVHRAAVAHRRAAPVADVELGARRNAAARSGRIRSSGVIWSANRSPAPSRRRIVPVVKRVLQRLVSLYLLFALIGRFVEGMGAVQCGCASDCWCKRPSLSLFRWVFPWGHHCP